MTIIIAMIIAGLRVPFVRSHLLRPRHSLSVFDNGAENGTKDGELSGESRG